MLESWELVKGSNTLTDVLSIEGQVPWRGTVSVSGAKNSILKLLPAALLSDATVVLSNVPIDLEDVREEVRLLRELGVGVEELDGERLQVTPPDQLNLAPLRSSRPFRPTYLFVPPQLRSMREALMPLPRGCNLGERKIDLHVMVWKEMGATISEEKDHLRITCPPTGLRGADITLPIRSVGATETALLSGAIAKACLRPGCARSRPSARRGSACGPRGV